MAADGGVQFYQSDQYVTVCLTLGQSVPAAVDISTVKGHFERTRCTLLEADQILWQSSLAFPVIPSQCKIKAGKKKIELKLRKESRVQWDTLKDDTKKSDRLLPPVLSDKKRDSTPATDNKQNEVESDDEDYRTPPMAVSPSHDSQEKSFDLLSQTTPSHNTSSQSAHNPDLTQADPSVHSNHMTTESGHVTLDSTAGTDHVTPDSNRMTMEPDHVTPDSNRMTIEPDHVTSDSNHMTMETSDSNRMTMEPDHVTREPGHVTFGSHSITSDIMEDVYQLKHLPHDLMEKNDNQIVSVKIHVHQVIPQSCVITFNKSSMIVQFKTTNNRFLDSYSGSSAHSFFTWSVNLFDAILPDQSKHLVTAKYIELLLVKATPSIKWKCLERPANRSLLLPAGSPLNDMNRQTEAKGQASSPINNVPALNNLDVDSSSSGSGASTSKPVGRTAMNFEFNPFNTNKISVPTSYDRQTLTDQQFKPLSPDLPSSPAPPPSDLPSSPTPPPPTEPPPSNTPPPQLISVVEQPTAAEPPPLPPPAAAQIKPFYRLSPDLFSGPSLTGISNLGNSCYMSTILQCLSNTVEVRDYFLGGKYKKDLNATNPLGFQGRLANGFHAMVDKLWSGDMQYISPRKLKDLLGSRREEFSGYMQQDAHEFTTFFLDGLHEDLNLIKEKPITPQIENNGRSDEVVAEESWINYKKRNDSFIADLFAGQFRSSLVCPECNKESVTFDPFMSLSVPLPQKSHTLSVIFFSKDPAVSPREIVVTLVPEATLELLKASVATKTNIAMKHLRMFEVYKRESQYLISDNKQTIDKIRKDDVIVICEVLSFHEAKEKVVEIHVLQRLQYPILPLKCSRKECRREGENFKRCSRCRSVAYCSRECQQEDWDRHKNKCKPNNRTPIALPFVISLPITALTYDNIAQSAEQYSSWTVTYDTTATTTATTTANGCSTLFELVPVNEYGELLQGEGGPLTNKGKETLTLPGKFLAMDWKNNPKELNVTAKDLTIYRTAAQKVIERESRELQLEDCLQLFTEPETLPKDNAWYCPVCKEHREATKRISVSRLPNVLIIHLKRFSFHSLTWRNKIDKYVDFPLKGLDMSPYVHGSTDKSSSTVYDLYATVNHYGAVYLGHYAAVVQSPEKASWLYYDDENVTKILRRSVKDNNAYLLFYRRRDL